MSKVMTSRLCITLSVEVLEALDKLCEALRVKRSEAVRIAVLSCKPLRVNVKKKG